jgi:hypothetical protein
MVLQEFERPRRIEMSPKHEVGVNSRVYHPKIRPRVMDSAGVLLADDYGRMTTHSLTTITQNASEMRY